ncbi:MAG: hypothetical protein N2Z21_09375 [Candidatus Sumerlaeaceae bacterium]|nr:hypothetical protein [Candidatus Sumerlaeaceae bacterium]
MRVRQIGLFCIFLLSGALCFAAGEEYSITGMPRWFKVKTEGQPCVVRDLASHRELGTLSHGDEILSFGVTDNWVTFSYAGRIGYVPTSKVEERYPREKVETVWRGFGLSVVEKIKQAKKVLLDVAMDANRLLNPGLKKPASAANQQGVGSASGQPLPGVQETVNIHSHIEDIFFCLLNPLLERRPKAAPDRFYYLSRIAFFNL